MTALRTLFFLSALSFLTSALIAQTTTGTLLHDGLQRNYRLHLPTGYSADQEYPLVFNLHGFTSDALQQEFYSGMNAVADTAGFIVCYPNGVNNAWNVGWSFGSTADDVGFIENLIQELAENYGIDTTRVYSCGMSNGGFMSYRLACELNDRIAAIASVTGGMFSGYLPQCEPGRPVPILEIHGTADDVVPYDGTPNVNAPVETTVNFWADNNGCAAMPDGIPLPNTAPNDGSTAERFDYPGCAAGSRGFPHQDHRRRTHLAGIGHHHRFHQPGFQRQCYHLAVLPAISTRSHLAHPRSAPVSPSPLGLPQPR